MTEYRVFVCKHVFDHSRPILLIANMAGDLCFLCGGPHADDPEEYEAVGINHVYQADPSVEKVSKALDINFEAERRSGDGEWFVKESHD